MRKVTNVERPDLFSSFLFSISFFFFLSYFSFFLFFCSFKNTKTRSLRISYLEGLRRYIKADCKFHFRKLFVYLVDTFCSHCFFTTLFLHLRLLIRSILRQAFRTHQNQNQTSEMWLKTRVFTLSYVHFSSYIKHSDQPDYVSSRYDGLPV